MRIVTKPGMFFNQLQWSRHHWLILVSFLVLAAVECQVGRHQALYQAVALIVQSRAHVSLDTALWIVTFGRLALLTAGAVGIATLVWGIGSLFGKKTSQRVLFRRLAVVFTVFLAGYTAQHLMITHPSLVFATIVFYVWGLVLGYFAIREQFELSHLETLVVGLFAVLLVTTSWHYSNHVTKNFVNQELNVQTAKQAPIAVPPVAKQSRAGRSSRR